MEKKHFLSSHDDHSFFPRLRCSAPCRQPPRRKHRRTRIPSRPAELALSNDTLQLRYYDRKDRVADSRFVGGAFLGEERDVVLSAAMMFPVDLADYFDITFGPQLYAALLNEENEDVMAVSLGKRSAGSSTPATGSQSRARPSIHRTF